MKTRALGLWLLLAMGLAPPASATVPHLAPSRLVIAHWLQTAPGYTPGEDYPSIFKDDVRSALEAGVDGFAINAFGNPLADQLIEAFVDAADAVGAPTFKVVLSADTSLDFAPSDMVALVKKWDSNPHYLRINGKPVLSTWNGGAYGDAWWQANVLGPLATSGHPVTFLPMFIGHDGRGQDGDPDLNLATEFPHADGFMHSISSQGVPFRVGNTNYGHAAYSELDTAEAEASAVHAAGKLWGGVLMPYYWASCHSVRQYYEWQGGRGMSKTWASIRGPQAADLVELFTWNDNTEGTYYQPTRMPGNADSGLANYSHLGYYELSKFYIQWYKTGVKPKVVKDAIFWFHRTQKAAAVASNDPCGIPINANFLWGSVKDEIFVTTALTAPGQVWVTSGGGPQKVIDVPAGVYNLNVPFVPGAQSIAVARNGTRLAGGSSNVDASVTARNFNVTSGYAVAGGGDSGAWMPSRTAPYSEWFK